MFDKLAMIVKMGADDDRSARELSKLNRTLIETSKADIKARDRVDIPLEEYTRLVSENKRLYSEVSNLLLIFHTIGIPEDVIRRVVPGSIDVAVCHDCKVFKERYRVEFDVERWPEI